MPRNKPTERADVIGKLELRPQNVSDEYFFSKQQDTFFVKPPHWDCAQDSIEMLFIENTREREMMGELQRAMLCNIKRQNSNNINRIELLYKQHDWLRKHFVKVNSFMRDCSEKLRVAEQTVVAQKIQQKELKNGIAKYTDSVDKLSRFRDELKITIEDYKHYDRIMEQVVKNYNIYDSVKDCMDRCDALMLAQVEINDLKYLKVMDIDNMRKKMYKLTNEAALAVLGLKNDLAKLLRSYNLARASCLKWESVVERAKILLSERELECERTIEAIHFIYKLLCNRNAIEPTLHSYEIHRSMNFIKHEIEMMVEVQKEMNKDTTGNSKKTDVLC